MKKPLRNVDLKGGRCKSMPPKVFVIPLNLYENEIEKKRDKVTYRKLQKLEKNYEELRQKLQAYSKQHIARAEVTRYLIWRSLHFGRRRPTGEQD